MKKILFYIRFIVLILGIVIICKIGENCAYCISGKEKKIELNAENLSNLQNYQSGWYKSWGGVYENDPEAICSIYQYVVSDAEYYIYINDPRVIVAVSEYDQNGKWIRYGGKFQNGGKYIKHSNAKYINLTIRCSVWGVSLSSLFENGLRIEFTNLQQAEKAETKNVDINEAQFSQVEKWNVGAFSYQTGEYIISPNSLAYEEYCLVENEEYIVNLPGGYLKLNILELDSENNVLASVDYESGQKWKKNPNTIKIALTLYTNDKCANNFTAEEYKQLIQEYPQFGLNQYKIYRHTGEIDNLTATELVKQINVGWNLGNSFDSKGDINKRGCDKNLNQEKRWGNPYVTKDLIDYVAKCGFNTIRIPVTWYYNSYIDENGYLHIGKGWLERVREVVDYAIANEMYVIINSHHDQQLFHAGVSEEEMQTVLLNTSCLWKEIAEYFKDYDEHLIFESFNEIDNLENSWSYSDLAAAQMNMMNQMFINTVRETGGNNSSRILMIPTLLDGTKSEILEAFIMPRDIVKNKIIVQVHTYTQKFGQDIDFFFSELEKFSEQIEAPIVIGEFGSTDSYVVPELRTVHASNFVARAASHGIRCIWWDNGSDYGIINRRNYADSNFDIIEALLEGSEGIAYNVTEGVELKNIDEYSMKMINLSTGNEENPYWGTLTTNMIPITKSGKCFLSLSVSGDASDIWLQRILFYDVNRKYISGKEIQKMDYASEIPENAAYVSVSMNSPYRSIKWEQYSEYLKNRKIQLGIYFVDASNIELIRLNVK